ncbi:MAG: peptidoglycan-binding protein, partial [Pseudomonadota bacterium]
KLLQIILIGQPELRDLLARPELEQLAQRVIARYHLGALTEDETERYIRHRLSVAGMTIAMPFDTKSIQRIHELSRGVPRRINLLADRALLGAYAGGKGQVDREIVDKAASEVFGREQGGAAGRWRPDRRAVWSIAALAGAALAALALLVYSWPRGVVAPPTAAASSARPLGSASAATASGGASAPAPAASAPTFLTAADLQSRFKSLPHDERDAWRELAPAWKLTLAADDADPCTAAQRTGLQCFRSASTTLALIRQLDRPGLLTLRDADDKPVYALLTGLTHNSATLRLGDVSQAVSLVSLATLWRGDFATFWRAPPGYAGRVVDAGSGAIANWVGTQLAALNGQPVAASEAVWKAQVSSFQLSQGLKADGLAGPTTFMQLNRATGIDEPRLGAGNAPRP